MLADIVSSMVGKNPQSGGDTDLVATSGSTSSNLPQEPTSSNMGKAQKRVREQIEQLPDERGSKEPKLDEVKSDDQHSGFHDLQKRYNDLLHSYRHQQLDNMELDKQHQQLESILASKSGEIRKISEKTHQLQRKLRAYDVLEGLVVRLIRENESLKRNESNLLEVNTKLRNNRDDLHNTQAKTEDELVTTAQQLASSQKEVEACKADLFRMKPMTSVPDSAVINEFEYLCEQITGWIDGEIYKFIKENPGVVTSQLFSKDLDAKARKLIAQYPDIGEHLVRYIVHAGLCFTIFGKNMYHLALSKGQNAFMKKLEKALRTLNPPKGKSDRARIQ